MSLMVEAVLADSEDDGRRDAVGGIGPSAS
jgi:hypothetical protein